MGIVDSDLYQTLQKPSNEEVYKEKGSKFIGYAFPLEDADQVETYISVLKKTHSKARHWCYAWQIGVSIISYRANDDGEPNNSAGMPIYGQIQSFELTNVLVAVARIFGGTKLGVGGLISSYRRAAQMALEESSIVEKTIKAYIESKFGYAVIDTVMRIIKQNQLEIVSQQFEMDCALTVSTAKNQGQQITLKFNGLKGIAAKLKGI